MTLAASTAVGMAHGADGQGKDVRDMKVFRFEFDNDNDTFLKSDDAFSAGRPRGLDRPGAELGRR